MLVVVSPAKNLDFETALPETIPKLRTQADLLAQTKKLVKRCKKLSPAELASLMKISDKLAILNAQRFASFEFPFTNENARPALFAFNGDVYTGIEANTLSEKALHYAQAHLRILSGLYGVLRPFDLMQAYRLEMGTKLNVGEAENLYQFWQDRISQNLNQALAKQGDDIIVNLASNEYFSAVKKQKLKAQVITPQFKDEKNGSYKVISFFAKKARGMMTRYILENEITSVAQLSEFDYGGYVFDAIESSPEKPVFKRKQVN